MIHSEDHHENTGWDGIFLLVSFDRKEEQTAIDATQSMLTKEKELDPLPDAHEYV
ncbi:MAG: hypothetical protein V3S89_06980 [Desulfobacterales bacterium]